MTEQEINEQVGILFKERTGIENGIEMAKRKIAEINQEIQKLFDIKPEPEKE